MEIDGSGDLIHQTYHMVDWKKVEQTPSDERCVTCGEPMLTVEPLRDRSGTAYWGRVCHRCKALFWLKEG